MMPETPHDRQEHGISRRLLFQKAASLVVAMTEPAIEAASKSNIPNGRLSLSDFDDWGDDLLKRIKSAEPLVAGFKEQFSKLTIHELHATYEEAGSETVSGCAQQLSIWNIVKERGLMGRHVRLSQERWSELLGKEAAMQSKIDEDISGNTRACESRYADWLDTAHISTY